MKTKVNINRVAKICFMSLTMAVTSATSMVHAKNIEELDEYKRLDNFNRTIGESIKFCAPMIAEDIEKYELQAAIERLDNLNATIEKSIKFSLVEF